MSNIFGKVDGLFGLLIECFVASAICMAIQIELGKINANKPDSHTDGLLRHGFKTLENKNTIYLIKYKHLTFDKCKFFLHFNPRFKLGEMV